MVNYNEPNVRGAAATREPPPRFIVSTDDIRGEAVRVAGAEGHHARNVLRLEKGAPFVAIDGKGGEYEAVVHHRTSDGVVGKIVRTCRRTREPVVQLTLALPLIRVAKLADIIGPATALGVWCFLLYECERTPKSGITDLERKHLRGVIAAAVKQSLRAVLPDLVGPLTWDEMTNQLNAYDLAFFCRPEPTTPSLAAVLEETQKPPRTFLVAVGPEGGYSPEEEATARIFKTLDLGPRRLRTEVAAIAACALVLNAVGDLGPSGPKKL